MKIRRREFVKHGSDIQRSKVEETERSTVVNAAFTGSQYRSRGPSAILIHVLAQVPVRVSTAAGSAGHGVRPALGTDKRRVRSRVVPGKVPAQYRGENEGKKPS